MGCQLCKPAPAHAQHATKFDRANFVATSDHHLDEIYDVAQDIVGAGGCGEVYIATKRATGAKRALKTISKKTLDNDSRAMLNEIEIMKFLDHPNIVRLYETFEDARNIYLVMELALGGELFDRIAEADDGFTEVDAAKLVRQILAAVMYLNAKSVCHRDLKPENFLLVEKELAIGDENQALKLIDFGFARSYETTSPMTTLAFTAYYVAPEVLTGSYGPECDVWSAGVMMYMLLSGTAPFPGESDEEVLNSVQGEPHDFDDEIWNNVSDDAKELMNQLLERDVRKRLTPAEALKHPWISKMAPNAKTSALSVGAFNNLKSFRKENKLKKAALTVIALEMTDSTLRQLKEMFLALDEDSDGTLTVEEMKNGIEKLGIQVPKDLEQMMREVDSDGSGQIDYTEFLAATMDRKCYMQQEAVWAAFRVFDLNNDGKITKEEMHSVLNGNSSTLESALGMQREEIEKIMTENDADGDGELDFEEFMVMIRGVQQSMND